MTTSTGWTAVVPVKPWALAKSRLHLVESHRDAVARAFAQDTLRVLAEAPSVARVVVVTVQKEMWSIAREWGARAVADRPLLTNDPLNAAVTTGRGWALSRHAASPIVVVPADLAAMTVEALETALVALAERESGFVADLAGTGTTLLAARTPAVLCSAYGRGSAAHHRALGLREAIGLDPRVRLDVDSRADLAEAQHLGLGPCATAVMEQILKAASKDRVTA